MGSYGKRGEGGCLGVGRHGYYMFCIYLNININIYISYIYIIYINITKINIIYNICIYIYVLCLHFQICNMCEFGCIMRISSYRSINGF